MGTTLTIIFYASFAGLPIFVGALMSRLFQSGRFSMKEEVNHFIVALGGGALVSAIAFVLVPRGLEALDLGVSGAVFLGGTVTFMILDILSSKLRGSMAQVLSMMMDFIPEALALGATFAHDHSLGLLLAVFIGLQNLPEGFNSYKELTGRLSSGAVLLLMFGLSFVGIFAALAGEVFLSELPLWIDSIMLFAAGGILYLVFQDIAPLSKIEKRWTPALGASVGFFLGMIGQKLV